MFTVQHQSHAALAVMEPGAIVVTSKTKPPEMVDAEKAAGQREASITQESSSSLRKNLANCEVVILFARIAQS